MFSVILSLLGGFLATFVVNLIVFGILALVLAGKDEASAKRGEVLVLILGMSAVGTCAGFSGGLSREPAVGAIIPAMFGILGGVVVYLFGVDRKGGAMASLMAACLSVSLFVSFVVSAQYRNYNDELRDLRTHCIAAYTDGKIIGNPAALAAFETRFLPYCSSALDWNLDAYHSKLIAPAPAAH
jgi:hypothetical protein